uniref:Uncharacterized protein n=1 Tax=Lepeophtheirus salmonis TaxID=72036 RepID=A0A0K2TYC8_LEPSM
MIKSTISSAFSHQASSLCTHVRVLRFLVSTFQVHNYNITYNGVVLFLEFSIN